MELLQGMAIALLVGQVERQEAARPVVKIKPPEHLSPVDAVKNIAE